MDKNDQPSPYFRQSHMLIGRLGSAGGRLEDHTENAWVSPLEFTTTVQNHSSNGDIKRCFCGLILVMIINKVHYSWN